MMKQTLLKATEGHILTDGTYYGKTVCLADSSSKDKIYEITEEKYNVIREAKKKSNFTSERKRI